MKLIQNLQKLLALLAATTIIGAQGRLNCSLNSNATLSGNSTNSCGFNFTAIMESIDVSNITELIAEKYLVNDPPSKYTINGAKPFSYNGPLNSMVNMARPFRESLMRDFVIQIFNSQNQFDIGVLSSNSVTVIAVIAITFLLSLISLLSAPFMIYNFYRKVQKEKMKKLKVLQEEKEAREAEQAAAKGLTARDLEKEKERKLREKKKQKAQLGIDDDQSEKIKIFSAQQRCNAVLFLLLVMSANLAFLIIAAVATAHTDVAFSDFRDHSVTSLEKIQELSKDVGYQLSDRYQPDYAKLISISIKNLPLLPLTQQLFGNMYVNVSHFSNNLTLVNQSYYDYRGNLSNLSSTLTQLQAKINELDSYLTSPLSDINSPQIPECQINSTYFPILFENSPIAVDYSTMPSFQDQLNSLENNKTLNNYEQPTDQVKSLFNQIFDNITFIYLNNTANQIVNFAETAQNISLQALLDVNNGLQNTSYQAKQAINQGAAIFAAKSNGAYVAIMFSFFASMISALLILFSQWRLLRFMNVCHSIILAVFWALCGFTLLFAYLNASACNAVDERFQTWESGLNLQTPKPQSDPLDNYLSKMFEARSSCLANNSIPFIQLSVGYAQYRSTDSQFVQKLSQLTNITAQYEFLLSNSWVFNAGIQFSSQTQEIFRGFGTPFTQINNLIGPVSTVLASAPTQAYRVQLQQRLLSTPNINDSISNTANQYIQVDLQSFWFNNDTVNQTQCLQDWPLFGQSRITNVVRPKINNLIAEINLLRQQAEDIVTNLDNSYDIIQSSTTYLQQYIANFNAEGSSYIGIQNNLNQTIFNNFIGPILVRISAYQVGSLKNLVDCSAAAEQLSQTEGKCQDSLIGFDASFWAYGALAVFSFLQIRAFILCAERLAEDSRWLIMALLLRQTNKMGDQTATDKLVRKTKINNTGTTYLDERDFDVSFNDPTLAHTRI